MIAGWSLFFNDLTEQLPLVVDGIKETCKLALIVSITGFLWGIIIFFLSLSHRPVVKAITRLYMDFFIGTPLILILLLSIMVYLNLAFTCPLLPWRLQGLL